MTLPLKDFCEPCKYCQYDPQSGWNVCAKHGGLTPQKQCDDFEERSGTTKNEAWEYRPITEDIILTPEQMSLYYMGYVDGMKWIIKYLQEPETRRPITDKEWDEFFKSIYRTKEEDEEG